MGKKAKRKADAPVFAVKPRRGAKIVRNEERMARVRTVLARTAAGRAEIDARIAGADMRGLAHLAVVEFPQGRPKLPGMRGRFRDEDDDELEADDDVLLHYTKPPIAPPVPFVPELERAAGILNAGEGRVRKPLACSACGALDHRNDSRKCPKHPSRVMPPVNLEPIEQEAGVSESEAHQPLPPNTIVRRCKACGRPRCRSDSRFCIKHPAYEDGAPDLRLAGAGGALRDQETDRRFITLTTDTINKLETIRMAMDASTMDDVILSLCVGDLSATVVNIPAPPTPITSSHAPESGDISTVVEQKPAENIPGPAVREYGFRTLAVRMPVALRTELFRMAGELDVSIDDLVNVALAALVGVPMHDEPAEEPPSIYRPSTACEARRAGSGSRGSG